MQQDCLVPANCKRVAVMQGETELFCAVANSEWGTIPGKSNGEVCWFAYNGAEHQTSDFHYLYADYVIGGANPLKVGQADGETDLFAAIAHTDHGDIPGKATSDACWYSYEGAEVAATSWDFVSSNRQTTTISGFAGDCQKKCQELQIRLDILTEEKQIQGDIKKSLDISNDNKANELDDLRAQNASLLGRIEVLLEDLNELRQSRATKNIKRS